MKRTLFVSDLHFGHKNILSYDKRPFFNIEEHDKEIIRLWNEVVKDDDEVWILGDVIWRNPYDTFLILGHLNGTKRLCVGNHDKEILKNKHIRDLFAEICDYKEISVRKDKVVLSHYPIPCFKNHFYGWYHLYGHVHNSFEWDMMEKIRNDMIEKHNVPCGMYNVGCMMPYMKYTPKTLEEVVTSYSMWFSQENMT